jgi:hypothetical protein
MFSSLKSLLKSFLWGGVRKLGLFIGLNGIKCCHALVLVQSYSSDIDPSLFGHSIDVQILASDLPVTDVARHHGAVANPSFF